VLCELTAVTLAARTAPDAENLDPFPLILRSQATYTVLRSSAPAFGTVSDATLLTGFPSRTPHNT
jgi:hypothetical protein